MPLKHTIFRIFQTPKVTDKLKTKEFTRNRIAAYVSLAIIIIALGVMVASWFMPNDNSDDSTEETTPTTTSEHNPLMDKMVTGTQQPAPPSEPEWKVPSAPGGDEKAPDPEKGPDPEKVPDPMAR